MRRVNDGRRRLKMMAAALAVLATLACGDSPTAPSAYAAYSVQDLQVGTGDEATGGAGVSVVYGLWLYDPVASDRKGPMVESNLELEPFEFVLGTGAVIAGFNDGVVGMREGGKRRIIVPPSKGYGNVRTGKIPPSATLVFEVDLIDVI